MAAAEIFHWTDASGIFHFTDNPYSILEDVRNSSMLIVRKDLQPAPSSSSEPAEPTAASGYIRRVHDCRAAFRPDGAKRRYIDTSAPSRGSRRTLRR